MISVAMVGFSSFVFYLNLVGDFFSGCIILGISGVHANSDDFPWKNPQRSIIISTNGRNTRIYDGFLWVISRKVVRIHMNSRSSLYRRIQIDYRQRCFLGGIKFRVQIQNRAARRINFHYRDRSLGISAENLSLQIQILSGIPISHHYRYRFWAQNELIL